MPTAIIHMFACHVCESHGYTNIPLPKGWVQDQETTHVFCCEAHYEEWKNARDTLPAPPFSTPQDEITQPDLSDPYLKKPKTKAQ